MARAQRNQIGWAIRTFLRLEHHRITSGTSWFESKLEIIRPAIQQFWPDPKSCCADLSKRHWRASAQLRKSYIFGNWQIGASPAA